MIEYRFTNDNSYYMAAYARYRQTHAGYHWYRALKVFGILVLLMCAIGAAIQLEWLPALMAVSIAMFIYGSTGLNNWYLKLHLKKSPHWNRQCSYRFSQSGVGVASDIGSSELSWQAFSTVTRCKDGYLLYQGPHCFHWLSDDSLTTGSPEEVDALFREYISGLANLV